MEKIARVVSEFYQVNYYEIFKRSRLSSYVKVRQMTIYLSRLYFEKSHQELASFFFLDHTSSIHSIKAVTNELQTSKEKRLELYEIKKMLFKANLILTPPAKNYYCNNTILIFQRISSNEVRE